MKYTDRELLEFAAKAAGRDVDASILFAGGCNSWNPLEDDGDALRLAVKLKLDIEFGDTYYFDEGDMTFCGTRRDSRESCYLKRFVKHKNDPYAATRRAIVRAAAELGRNMK